jgi:uncharacterized protein with NRDE domain
MCLVLLAHRALADFPLVLAANRDEFFARPSAPAAWWRHGDTDVFGGRDLDKGGTWLGVTRKKRFAVVTNVRDGAAPAPQGVGSRGWLVRDALSGPLPPTIDRGRFPTFNLIVGEGDDVFYLRDDDAVAARIAPGVHGLSNHRLDTPWPKVERAVAAFGALGGRPDAEALFRILADDAAAPDDELPSTGVPLEVERALSPPFVRLPAGPMLAAYGTRCSTVVLLDASGAMTFEERTFDEHGALRGTVGERIP